MPATLEDHRNTLARLLVLEGAVRVLLRSLAATATPEQRGQFGAAIATEIKAINQEFAKLAPAPLKYSAGVAEEQALRLCADMVQEIVPPAAPINATK